MKTETVVFNGITFTRYPESASYSLRHYYRHHRSKSKYLFLHREVWKAHHKKEIPKGYHIHHVDGDTANNDPSNLQSISNSDHVRHHQAGNFVEAKKKRLDRVRHLGWAWHSTEEGIAYHRKTQTEWVAGQPSIELVCSVCKKKRMVKKIGKFGSKFCSEKCRRDSGHYDESRTCKHCSEPFVVPRYKKTVFCSKTCASRSNAARLKQRAAK